MFSSSRRTSVIRTYLVVAAVFVGSIAASADPPDRVARVGFVSGTVSLRPAPSDEWALATLNHPMTTGDDVWTTATGRVELQLPFSAVRLAANTSFSIINLDNRVAQFSLMEGTLSVSVRDIDHALGEVIEVDTPNGAVSLLQPGFYRIEVGPPEAQTTVTVRHGTANVATAAAVFDLGESRSAVITGSTPPRYSVRAADVADEWEDWCQWRERRVDDVLTQMYVSPDVIGYEDLDEFGSWKIDATLGPIWIPDVPADWAPYRFGHWAWVEPWGWTWIDDAPWGFAPSHYGRWASLDGRWTWVPGSFLARAVYAPALVAFVTGANGIASPGTSDPVGWFPLAPGEAFVPAYQVSQGYLLAINAMSAPLTAVDIKPASYLNRTVPGAMTAVPRDAFVSGRPVAPVRIPAQTVRGASVVGAAPPRVSGVVSVSGQNPRGTAPPAPIE